MTDLQSTLRDSDAQALATLANDPVIIGMKSRVVTISAVALKALVGTPPVAGPAVADKVLLYQGPV